MKGFSSVVIVNNLLKKNCPASVIEQDLLEALSEKGINIRAYCSSLGNYYAPSDAYKTIIVKEYPFWRYIFAFIRKILPDLTYLPDYLYLSWGIKARNLISNYLSKKHIDYIQSFSFECSNHLIAYQLKKKYDIPWIATFFDSWSDYPHRIFKFKFFRQLDLKMEALVAENADIIIHNNHGIARLWEKRYGEEIGHKIRVIPLNVNFENETEPQTNNSKGNILNIIHIGTFYPGRDAGAFIEAVSYFLKLHPEFHDKIKVSFIGKVLKDDVIKIKRLGLSDLFYMPGVLQAKECQTYYLNADIFLATAGIEIEEITFPSKIIKYLYYRKPILGISPCSSILSEELKKANHMCFLPNDIEGISNYLYNALTDYPSICNFNYDYWKQFSIKNVVCIYEEIINNLIK